MIRNFIVTSLRILWRNKLISAINILSLSIGITAFILILLYVHHETSYDQFNENYDRIYRLEGDEYAKLPPLIGEYIADKIPEIEQVTKFQIAPPLNFNYIPEGNSGDIKAIQIPIIRVDSTIFDVFTFPLVLGNANHALNEAFEVVLTESFARRLFGKTNPMGKTIVLGNQYYDNNEYQVTGILKDIHQSHLNIDALISSESAKISNPDRLLGANKRVDRGWWTGTYLLLSKNTKAEIVEQKINSVLQDINDESMIPIEFNQFYLRSIKDLYLNQQAIRMAYGKQGNSDLIWSLLAVGLFILLLAIINYINLTTARSTLRSKEIMLKKVVGSSKWLLGKQFIGESIILVFLSFLIALTAIQLIMPMFNQLSQVHILLSDFSTPLYWTLLLAGIISLGIASGIYPAVILSRLRPVASIRSKSVEGIRGVRLRRILLTVQFSISIVLLIGIITNLRQIQFFKNADPGFNKNQVLQIRLPFGQGEFFYMNTYDFRKTFKDRLLQYPNIIKVSMGSTFLSATHQTGAASFLIEINGRQEHIQRKIVDPDFFDVMDIKFVEGRNFSWDRQSDYSGSWTSKDAKKQPWIINETAAREFWDESPIGKTIYDFDRDGTKIPVEIIGVVKDVHWTSMHHKVEPLEYRWGWERWMNIKIAPNDIQRTISFIESEWKELYGSEPFIYSFMNEEFDAQYKSDERIATIIGYFTVLAIVIACMGLLGLSSFMAVRRTKEIGIRKALGASSNTIFVMLSREYLKWILLSALIASPIAWYAMNKWLETFAYRIELGPWVFILAAVIALTIGLITVGWQALKSAVANPVEALRYE